MISIFILLKIQKTRHGLKPKFFKLSSAACTYQL